MIFIIKEMYFLISERILLGNYPLLMDAKDPLLESRKKLEALVLTAESFLVLFFRP